MALPIREQVQDLLDQNLFLDPKVRTRIASADDLTLAQILPTLQQMEAVQHRLITSALAANPHFFSDLKNGLTHEVLSSLVKKEIASHQQEIETAEQELSQMLSRL